jgi:hypothetical protein
MQSRLGQKVMHILGHFPSYIDLKLLKNFKTQDVSEAGSAFVIR